MPRPFLKHVSHPRPPRRQVHTRKSGGKLALFLLRTFISARQPSVVYLPSYPCRLFQERRPQRLGPRFGEVEDAVQLRARPLARMWWRGPRAAGHGLLHRYGQNVSSRRKWLRLAVLVGPVGSGRGDTSVASQHSAEAMGVAPRCCRCLLSSSNPGCRTSSLVAEPGPLDPRVCFGDGGLHLLTCLRRNAGTKFRNRHRLVWRFGWNEELDRLRQEAFTILFDVGVRQLSSSTSGRGSLAE